MLPSGHRLPRSRGLAAAASGRRVSAFRHAGSRGPRHRAGPVAVVGRARLPQRPASRDDHQQRLQLHSGAPRLPRLCIPAARPRGASHAHHPGLHQPRGLRGGHCRPALPSQSQTLPLQLPLHPTETSQGRHGVEQPPGEVMQSSRRSFSPSVHSCTYLAVPTCRPFPSSLTEG